MKEECIILKEEKKDSHGPPRKYYEITEKGLLVLKKGEKFLKNIANKIS